MKRLLLFCAFMGSAMGIIASCGPERSFCPNNPPMYNCLPDASAQGGQGGTGTASKCPNGGSVMLDQNGTCTCSATPPYPCAF